MSIWRKFWKVIDHAVDGYLFAMRARSHEGKLQVHLAQLKYLLPRLVGQGLCSAVSRGNWFPWSRVPAELNRRSVRNQIIDNERQLKVVEKIERQSEKRLESSTFKISFDWLH